VFYSLHYLIPLGLAASSEADPFYPAFWLEQKTIIPDQGWTNEVVPGESANRLTCELKSI